MLYRLLLQTGSTAGMDFPLEKPELSIGRDLGNDIVINDPEVSRRHAHLFLTGDTYAIEDLGSTNGTYLGGQRINAPTLLTPGAVITLGENITLIFEAIPNDPDATIAVLRRSFQSDKTQVSGQEQPVSPVPVIPQPVQNAPEPLIPPTRVPPRITPSQPIPAPPQAPAKAARPAEQESISPLPASEPMDSLVAEPRKRSRWVTAILIVIGILLVFCVIPWIIIEITNSYCALFPGIFNFFSPGVCP